jgi:hypothetical protein
MKIQKKIIEYKNFNVHKSNELEANKYFFSVLF